MPTSPPELPQAQVRPASTRNLSLVWIVPIVAALAGLWLLYQTVSSQGPTITLRFDDAEGIEADKTKIRFKNVDIGEVKEVSVSKDRRHVILTAQLAKAAADFLVSDTRFWIVRPRVAAGNVSGLGTLLSGAYIGVDVGTSSQAQRDFVGLEVPPIVTAHLPGREFVLHAPEIGSLDVGAQVSFRHIAVGQVIAFSLDPDGHGVTLKVFVNAPYDQYVTESTRFWNASGIDLSLDANGLKLQTQSLASLIEGGVAFQTPPDAPVGKPAAPDTSFELFAGRDQAMRPVDVEHREFVTYFKDTLRGLSPGAPIDFHGINVGEVKQIGIEYVRASGVFRFPVTLTIYPERMKTRDHSLPLPGSFSEAQTRTLVDRLVGSGMRAELKTGNLLTGQMYVALDFHPSASRATIDWSHAPPVLPSTGNGLSEVQDSVVSILHKVDELPLDELSKRLLVSVEALNQAINDSDHLVRQLNGDLAPEARALLGDARQTLGSARQAIDSTQQSLAGDAPLQLDVRETLRQVSRTAQALGALADFLERHPDALIRGRPPAAKPGTTGDPAP